MADRPVVARDEPGASVSVSTVVAGRYRLVARAGASDDPRFEFWRGHDTVLARDIGLTVVLRGAPSGEAGRADPAVGLALRWGQYSFPGCARLLDVVSTGLGQDRTGLPDRVCAVVVTDWAGGSSVAEALRAGAVDPVVALSMILPLAEAAEQAHLHGLVLGSDHPEQLQVVPGSTGSTRETHVRLAFVRPAPEATPAQDVHGLGALLCALLTGAWPASGSEGSGASAGRPGRTLDSAPAGIAGLARAALTVSGPDGATVGQLTSAEFRARVAELLDVERAAQREREDAGTRAGASAVLPGTDYWALPPEDDFEAAGSPRGTVPARLVAIGFCVLALLGYLSVRLGIGGWPAEHPPSDPAGTPPAASASVSPGDSGQPQSGSPAPADQAPPSTTALPVGAQVYDPTGQPDNPSQVWRALGTDPRAGWSTETYLQPFPTLKPGVGIMVTFAAPVQLSGLTITSPSVGSRMQIRAAPSSDSRLDHTTLITDVTVGAGDTSVSLANSQPVQHILVWITKLGGGGDANVTEISNLRFQRADD
ncbi:MAG TPA: hypothetical protein VGH89_23270 [Pseudonocardia sp.]